MSGPAERHVDVLIVGAGLSGIGAAWHLQQRLPGLHYAILEARDAIGGTWDLFRYPGVRSDSDMFTLGYTFRPWDSDRSIVDGASIRDYVRDTAREFGIDRHVRFGHKVSQASWDSQRAEWTVQVAVAGQAEEQRFVCRFLYLCSGYYDYAQGHDPQWPGQERFEGTLVHAQHWPEGLATAGRRIVVVGSGATAVTLVPELARDAAQVTMLQRSPTYIASLPSRDAVARVVRRALPRALSHRLVRLKNVLLQGLLYQLARRRPEGMARFLQAQARKQLPPGYDLAHFTPRYRPWDQRLCLVPDGDLFTALREGRAAVATDEIEQVLPQGIQLRSGAVLPADIIVKATGLKLQLLGGARLLVDGRPVSLSDTVAYKGVMFSGVPNLVSTFGYTNASWTLKAELIARYVCRLLGHMQRHRYDLCVPELADPAAARVPVLDLSAGYIQRAIDELPRQGVRRPWRMHQNYWKDLVELRWMPLADGTLRFARRGEAADARKAVA